MNSIEINIAMVEIPLGITWSKSKIKPKTAEKKSVWDKLTREYKAAVAAGKTWTIPSEIEI